MTGVLYRTATMTQQGPELGRMFLDDESIFIESSDSLAWLFQELFSAAEEEPEPTGSHHLLRPNAYTSCPEEFEKTEHLDYL